MKLFLITALIIGFCIAAIAIKMFVKKGGEFKKRCASIEFENGEKIACVCHSERHEDCQYYELHHGKKATEDDSKDK